jgi:hypothetical protein
MRKYRMDQRGKAQVRGSWIKGKIAILPSSSKSTTYGFLGDNGRAYQIDEADFAPEEAEEANGA